MSLDADYILVYDNLGYVPPTPMVMDTMQLQEKYGGCFQWVTETTIYWHKPKYTLPPEEVVKLYADQVLERKDCELWKIIK